MLWHQENQTPRPDFEIAALIVGLAFLGTIVALSVGSVVHAKYEIDRRSLRAEIHEAAVGVFPRQLLQAGVGTASAIVPFNRQAQ